jgi:hypothetical protein
MLFSKNDTKKPVSGRVCSMATENEKTPAAAVTCGLSFYELFLFFGITFPIVACFTEQYPSPKFG